MLGKAFDKKIEMDYNYKIGDMEKDKDTDYDLIGILNKLEKLSYDDLTKLIFFLKLICAKKMEETPDGNVKTL